MRSWPSSGWFWKGRWPNPKHENDEGLNLASYRSLAWARRPWRRPLGLEWALAWALALALAVGVAAAGVVAAGGRAGAARRWLVVRVRAFVFQPAARLYRGRIRLCGRSVA